MRKVLIGITTGVLAMFVLGAATLTTRASSYRTLDTLTDAASAVDTDLAAATGYALATGAPTGAIDLLKNVGAGSDTFVNAVSLIVHATGAADDDTVTQKLYGLSDQGVPQLIASIVWTIGTARPVIGTTTHLWAHDAVITSTHIKSLTAADGGDSDRICSVTFDVTGYRYLYSLITAQTGDPTLITVLYRHF